MRRRSFVFAGIATAGIIAAAVVAANRMSGTVTRTTLSAGQSFELTSQIGKTVNNATLAGRPYLAFFGFTHCPDICPTTLFELTGLMQDLGPLSDTFNVLMISVDPERDTQELLALYMTAFDSRFTALRGTRQQTDQAIAAFSAYARKVPTEGGYTMEHTAGVYLMDAEGRFRGKLDMHEPWETRLQKLRNLAARSGKMSGEAGR